MTILAGDIGGTNTRLALYTKERSKKDEKIFPSANYQSLEEILREFLQERVDIACFGIAGPIKDNHCEATNLPWVIDGKSVAKENSIPQVFLINDLLANAYGIRALKEEEFFTLNKGADQMGNGALISAGTGLGQAGLFWDNKQYLPFASEGGHADFAPRNSEEMELLTFLQGKWEHVSYERLISGPGIYNIYQFYTQKKGYKEIDQKLKEEEYPRALTELALQGTSDVANKVLDTFLSLYGAESGNVALKFLALSGVYLGGGIAPKVLELLKKGAFMKAFSEKGRFSQLMKSIPVKVILNDQAALLGALEFALMKESK